MTGIYLKGEAGREVEAGHPVKGWLVRAFAQAQAEAWRKAW
jgi:hypothetical protein